MFKSFISSNENLYIEKVPKKCKINLNLTTNPLGPGINYEKMRFQKSYIENYNEPGEMKELKLKISECESTSEKNIMITAGADQALEILLSHCLSENECVGIHEPTFSRFEIYAKNLCGARILHFKSLKNIPPCKVIVLCSPNNPSTVELKYDEIRKILENNPDTAVIVDNVFFGYGKENLSSLVKEFGNLFLIKSFSKLYGLPGLRVGWIESREENISKLEIGISPFRASYLNQFIALKSLENPKHIQKSLEYVRAEFSKIKSELKDRVVRESNVPFFLFKTGNPKKDRDFLFNQGINVIDSTYFNNADFGFLRISLGTPEENREVMHALKRII